MLADDGSPAGLDGSVSVYSVPLSLTAVHCSVVGHATPRSPSLASSVTSLRVVRVTGSNVMESPASIAVHCAVSGQETLNSSESALTTWLFAVAVGEAGEKVTASPFSSTRVHCETVGQAIADGDPLGSTA